MKRSRLVLVSVFAAWGVARATLIASDSRANYANPPTFATGQNAGFGFGTWTLSATGAGGSYLGGTGLGSDTFGIFAGGEVGNQMVASRTFGSALNPGDEFSISLGHTTVNAGGEIGLTFFAGGNYRLNFKTFSSGFWQLNDGGSDFATNIPYSIDTPLTFKLTRGDSGNLYSLDITQGAANFPAVNFSANSGIMNIDRIDIYSKAQGSGQNLGFNNLAINTVPEPASGALIFLGLVAVILRRRG